MNKVVHFEYNKVHSERTLFRSALMEDCVRYFFSLKNRENVLVLNKLNEIVDTKEYLDVRS